LSLDLDEPGKEIEAPMTIVIFGGLFTSTALNMIVVPGFFSLVRTEELKSKKVLKPVFL
jgi:Cu/Ag efflux pump CusA